MQRIEDIKKYVDFDDSDAETLQRLGPIVEPHLETVADRLYESLQQNEYTNGFFEGDETSETLKESLRTWLMAVFDASYGEEHAEGRRQIGESLIRLGLKPQYMFAAVNLVRTEMIKIVVQEDHDIDLTDALTSIERILDIDLAMILDGYWEALLSEKARAGAELATRLAHEIRNPLNAIGLNLTLLERKLGSSTDDSDRYVSSLQAIRTELQRVEALTKEIKEYSQPISPTPGWHDFDALLDEIESAYGPTLEANDIRLQTQIAESASDVYCDAEQIKQAIINLVQNSIESIDNDGTIEIGACTRDGRTVVEVADSGDGMKRTATERAFDLFYTTKASGTGIGLPMVKKIVDAHQGTIDFLNHASEDGTTVRITLPKPATQPDVN